MKRAVEAAQRPGHLVQPRSHAGCPLAGLPQALRACKQLTRDETEIVDWVS
jgi:hypothetical protein